MDKSIKLILILNFSWSTEITQSQRAGFSHLLCGFSQINISRVFACLNSRDFFANYISPSRLFDTWEYTINLYQTMPERCG